MKPRDAVSEIEAITTLTATIGGSLAPDRPLPINVTHTRLNRLGISAELFEPGQDELPEALLMRAVIQRAIEDAVSRPAGDFHHRWYRRDARKWLWRRSQAEHGYGWTAALIGWGEFEMEKVHRFVFPDGKLGC